MADRAPESVVPSSIALEGVRFWKEDWKPFSRAHPDLAEAVTPISPLYCLPTPAIDTLARTRRTSPPLLDEASAKAERELADLCRKHGAVGCWPGRPIPYAPLAPCPIPLDESEFQRLGWTRSIQLRARQALTKAEEAGQRLKGYVGWLLTEPPFLAEVSGLRERWDALSERQRPTFPLARPLPLPGLASGAASAPPALAEFAAAVQQFLDRWGLMQLTTWDLPDPQGPWLASPLRPGAPAMPRHGVHLILPLHYPLQGDDNLLDQILTFQRQYAREQGLDESLAGLAHYRVYANMLDVLHLERMIRARCLARRHPRGLVSWIEDAIVAVMGGSLARVQKLRKAIAACQRGQRARVTWLRPRHQ